MPINPNGVHLEHAVHGTEVYINGLGTKCMDDGLGSPVYIDFAYGEPVLYVWADINNEDYTHRIPLGGAREDMRDE